MRTALLVIVRRGGSSVFSDGTQSVAGLRTRSAAAPNWLRTFTLPENLAALIS